MLKFHYRSCRDPDSITGSAHTRREFLQRGALAVAALSVPAGLHAAEVAPRKLFTGIGVTSSIARAAAMKEAGADFIVESAAGFLIPDRPEADFEPSRARAASSPLPVLGCNSFLRDPKLRCTGPNADHPRVLAYAETAFRRLREIGGEYMVFGSNGARRLPEGWSKEQGDEQFISLLRAMGPLAARHKIMVAVESQRKQECNYLNKLSEIVNVVAGANHPYIRALADLYHMAVEGDTPDDLAKAMPWVSVLEIAEKERRTYPGVAGDDFRPYFAVLAQAGFSGRIDIEGNGTPEQLKAAFVTVARQAAEVASTAPVKSTDK